jgi:hypothetical protein
MSQVDIERRLSNLEREFHSLKGLLVPSSTHKDWRDTFGTFADDPGFDELLRLGREIREQDREAQKE